MKLIKKINILRLPHQGFCYGVTNALKIVIETINSDAPRPLYLLGSLVHNAKVTDFFVQEGITVLKGKSKIELLDEITEGTVIFTAHGVSDMVMKKAQHKGLHIVDATCPYVKKSYELIKDHLNQGYHIIYQGKLTHPETEAVSSLSKRITIIENNRDIPPLVDSKIAFANQTTLSNYDVEDTCNKLLSQYPNLVRIPMVCNATETRQSELAAVLQLTKDFHETLVVIVGDLDSNNCLKLFELAKRYTDNVIFINDVSWLTKDIFNNYRSYIISSGTSTPVVLIDEIVKAIKQGDVTTSTLSTDQYTKEK